MPLSRRRLLACAAAGAWGVPALHAATPPLAGWLRSPAFFEPLQQRLHQAPVPGLALVVIDGGEVVHSAGHGWADMAAQRAMSAATLINIASVTKLFTCTALLQFQEQGRLDLDAPADRWLPFRLRHPAHPERPITARQLLTHTAAVADGAAYGASYACGDPQTELGTWLRTALAPAAPASAPAGAAEAHFRPWAPGERHAYSNVAYGLLGLMVEQLAGLPYTVACQRAVLAPLGMVHSRFLLAGLNRSEHATPYEFVPDGQPLPAELRAAEAPVPVAGGAGSQVPLCLYSFATVSDGLLRSSAAELARFALAMLRGGELEGRRVLRAGTWAQMLRDQNAPLREAAGYRQGLAWRGLGDGVWAHMGSDPGVAAALQIHPDRGRAVVLLANGSRARPLVGRLAAEIMAWRA